MHEIILIFLIAIVTLLTRAIPFLFFKDKTNQFIEFLEMFYHIRLCLCSLFIV